MQTLWHCTLYCRHYLSILSCWINIWNRYPFSQREKEKLNDWWTPGWRRWRGLCKLNFCIFENLRETNFGPRPRKPKKTCLVQCPQFFYFPLQHRYTHIHTQLLHNLTIEIDNLYKRILYLLTRVGTHSRLFIIEGRSHSLPPHQKFSTQSRSKTGDVQNI